MNELSAEHKETIRHTLDAHKRDYWGWCDKFAESDTLHPEVTGWLGKAEAELAARHAIPSSTRAAFSKALIKVEQKLQSWTDELNGIEVGAANKLFKTLNQQIGAYTSLLGDLDRGPALLERLVEKMRGADHIGSWMPQELARADWNALASCFRAGAFDVEQIKRNQEAIADLEETVRRAIAAGNFSRVAGGVKKRDDGGRPVSFGGVAGYDPRSR